MEGRSAHTGTSTRRHGHGHELQRRGKQPRLSFVVHLFRFAWAPSALHFFAPSFSPSLPRACVCVCALAAAARFPTQPIGLLRLHTRRESATKRRANTRTTKREGEAPTAGSAAETLLGAFHVAAVLCVVLSPVRGAPGCRRSKRKARWTEGREEGRGRFSCFARVRIGLSDSSLPPTPVSRAPPSPPFSVPLPLPLRLFSSLFRPRFPSPIRRPAATAPPSRFSAPPRVRRASVRAGRGDGGMDGLAGAGCALPSTQRTSLCRWRAGKRRRKRRAAHDMT